MPAPLTGQSGAVSSTPVQLDPNNTAASCTTFAIKAPLSNSKPVFIGASGVSSTTGYQLDPGDVEVYERQLQNGVPPYQQRVTDFYVVGTSPDIVVWQALQ